MDLVKLTLGALVFKKPAFEKGSTALSNHAKMAFAGTVRAVVFLSLTAGIFAAVAAVMTYGLPKLGQKYPHVADFLKAHSQALATAQKVNLFAGLVATGLVTGCLLRQAPRDHASVMNHSFYDLKQEILSYSLDTIPPFETPSDGDIAWEWW